MPETELRFGVADPALSGNDVLSDKEIEASGASGAITASHQC